MVRPKKCRYINTEPGVNYFKPVGIPLMYLEDSVISVEEYEAVRLGDLNGLNQTEAAEQMKVSQPTFNRVLNSARKKIADAIVNGKAIKIHGGNFKMAPTSTRESGRRFRCFECTNEWEEPFGTGRPAKCPKCGSTNLHRVNIETGGFGRHGRRGRV